MVPDPYYNLTNKTFMERRFMGKYGTCFKEMYKDYNVFLKQYKNEDKALLAYFGKLSELTENDYNQRAHARGRSDLFYKDIKGCLLHFYFIDKELKSYLMEMDVPDYKNTVEMVKASSDDDLYPFLSKGEKSLSFCMHFPDDSFGYVVKFTYEEEMGEMIIQMIHENGEDFFITLSRAKEFPVYPIVKLAVNVLFYVNCFPECVLPGLPKGARLINGFTNPKLQVKTSNKIMVHSSNSDGHVIAPHFRKGHFRYLASDYYVNKKGQTIFIEATFVKGNSKFVETEKSIKEKIS